ncbi:MAG: hypothetical protein WC515_04420 [Candidatus Omnitrophota bacterium]
MVKLHKIRLVAALFLCAAVSGGCAPRHADDDKVIARVNRYEMTLEDLRDELATRGAGGRHLAAGTSLPTDDLLDELITKKVLVQEAQRQDFDKDRMFMKEIERYWEQALIKILLKKKTRELARTIKVSDEEARDEYGRIKEEEGGRVEPYEMMASGIKNDLRYRKIQEALDKWVIYLKKEANVRIYKENIK